MQHKSEDVAEALATKIVQELGRLCVQRNRDNRDLRRLFRRIGIDRHALGVPVLNKLGDKNEDSNIIELDRVVSDCRDRNRVRQYIGMEIFYRNFPGNSDK